MGYLSLTRKEGEKVFLSFHPDADPHAHLRELTEHCITLIIGDIGGGKARIKIEASKDISVLKAEPMAL